jgi:protein SCO1/2
VCAEVHAANVAPGARADEPAPELEGVGVEEKLGGELPLDLTFTDETGAPVVLGSLFEEGVPVLLTFNYSACQTLCSVQLGGLVASMNGLSWSIGDEYRVITIGLNPMEGHRRAMDTKLRYLDRYKPGSAEQADAGWRFLTGSEQSIRQLAEAAGFRYRLHPETGEYLHPAAVAVVSPSGSISSYVYGVEFPAAALAVTLLAAREGRLLEATEKFLLACFHFERPQGAAAVALRVMRVGGFVFVAGLLIAFATVRIVRSRRRALTRVRDVPHENSCEAIERDPCGVGSR